MLYTRKGDNGTTKLFDSKKGRRLEKNALVFEALGTLDELNSAIGHAKALSLGRETYICFKNYKTDYQIILEKIQNILFIIQAELGGSPKHANKSDVAYLEDIIYEVETVIPPITSFIIPGGKETGSYLDVTRTIARRAERIIISLNISKEREVHETSIQFLNRLSSALYALARFINYKEGYWEQPPRY